MKSPLAQIYRAQRIFALTFALFLVIHLASTVTGLAGEAAFDRWVGRAHLVYGHLAIEILIWAALAGHAAASLWLWWKRKPGVRIPWANQVQGYAGFTLLAFMPGHLLFTRFLPAADGFKPAWLYLWTSTHIWPVFFVPYYGVLATAGAIHLFYGSARFLKIRVSPWIPLAAASVLGAAFFVLSVRIATVKPAHEPSDAELKLFLRPYEQSAWWLLDMTDDHPYVLRYEAAKQGKTWTPPPEEP